MCSYKVTETWETVTNDGNKTEIIGQHEKLVIENVSFLMACRIADSRQVSDGLISVQVIGPFVNGVSKGGIRYQRRWYYE